MDLALVPALVDSTLTLLQPVLSAIYLAMTAVHQVMRTHALPVPILISRKEVCALRPVDLVLMEIQ